METSQTVSKTPAGISYIDIAKGFSEAYAYIERAKDVMPE